MSFTVTVPVISNFSDPVVSVTGGGVSITSLPAVSSDVLLWPGTGSVLCTGSCFGTTSFSASTSSSIFFTLQAIAVFSILCTPPQHMSTPNLVNTLSLSGYLLITSLTIISFVITALSGFMKNLPLSYYKRDRFCYHKQLLELKKH